jgi:Flp pilus assembly protein TadD
MLRQTTTLLLTLLLLFVVVERDSITTAGPFDWTTIPAAEDGKTDTEETTGSSDAAQKKKGNGFVRALSAPFRALGRLFGGGKKDKQVARTSVKDASKFEVANVTRIKDARSPASPPSAAPQPAAVPSSPTVSAAAPHFERGRELLLAGDVNGAIAELTTATSLEPKSSEAHTLLGVAYENKGLRDRALQSFEVALHADEDNAEHLNNFGFLLYKNGDFDRAAKYLKKAAKLSPTNPRIWNNLGLVQSERGHFDDAYRSFTRATDEFGARLSIAAQLQQRGRAKEAIKHLEKALGLRQNSVEVLNKLVALYEVTGRSADAEMARRSIIALKTFADVNK